MKLLVTLWLLGFYTSPSSQMTFINGLQSEGACERTKAELIKRFKLPASHAGCLPIEMPDPPAPPR